MKKKSKPIIFLGIVILIFASKLFFEERGTQNEGNFKRLLSIKPQDITTFKIYPEVIKPFGIPCSFNASDSVITDFFQLFSDIQKYQPNHDTVWDKQQWALEIFTSKIDKIIPIGFYIPTKQGNIVIVDMLGNDGYFQSQKLYQWYQKHSHRWLEPEQNDTN